MIAHQNILDHSHLLKEPNVLEGPPQYWIIYGA